MTEKYDPNNIFAKIIAGQVPCKKIYEDELILCFYDINPEAKIHALIIPKLACLNFSDFVSKAGPLQVASFFSTIKHIAENVLKLTDYRLKTNNGKGAGQDVFHFHVHLLSN